MSTDRILAVLADPTTSYWLSDALKSALTRDPLDALRDAEILTLLLSERLSSADTTVH